MSTSTKRKKWSEAEERTLIDKYGAMVSDGTLAKMKTREKKFRPIALYVNSMYHNRDPVSYPWPWSWKDVSTKVQNMRHQYLLVKQKIKRLEAGSDSSSVAVAEEFDWEEGPAYWSNFLRYKEVFGDVPLAAQSSEPLTPVPVSVGRNDEGGRDFDDGANDRRIVIAEFGNFGHSGDGDFIAGIDGGENGVLELGFGYDGEEGEDHFNGSNHVKDDGEEDGFVYEELEANGSESKKKKGQVLASSSSSKEFESKALVFLGKQLSRLKEMEARFEQREVERERERQRREHIRAEFERERAREREEIEKGREELETRKKKLRMQEMEKWQALEKESEERMRRRREEAAIRDREWEERMNQRRSEWRKQLDEMLDHHRVEMGQMQSRILQEQQNITNHLLGLVSQWAGHPTALSDHTGASNHYLSQMMQNLHHVNGMVHDDTRVDGDNQDDQFIVDG